MIYISQSEGSVDLNKILETVSSHNTNEILLLGESEWEFKFGGKPAVDELKKQNISLKIMHGSFRNEYYEKLYAKLGVNIDKDVIFWPTFWLNWSEMQLVQQIDHYTYQPLDKFKHSFICLNNRSHLHRCATVEELAKTGLIDKGVVTWHDFLQENSDYPFKFFDRTKKRVLSDDFATKLDSFLIPEEFHESFFHLVTEATNEIEFLTEKTSIPLLLKKPFVAVGACGYHNRLKSLGFKLYDELIDYSFDSEPDLNKRVEMLVNEMHKIVSLDLSTAYSLIKDKAEYNYNRTLEIIYDSDFIPDKVKQLVEEHGDDPKLGHNYKCFVEQTKPISSFNVWSFNGSLEENVNQALQDQASEFIIDSANELESIFISENEHTPHINRLIEAGIHVHTILPTHEKIHEEWIKEKTNNNVWQNTDIVHWPLYWGNRTFYRMAREWERSDNASKGMDIFDNNVCLTRNHYDYLFVSLNNVPKTHRYVMMDMLAKYNLIDSGAIAWRDQVRGPDGSIVEDQGPPGNTIQYSFKYWKNPRRMFLDQENVDQKTVFFNQEALVKEFDSSFMQLVPETEDNQIFITEKTIVPLLFNKPFLVAGGARHHEALKTLGFELYDEIFDYSFDSIENMEERNDKIAQNIHSIKDKNLVELRELIKHKLIHNRNLLLSYIFDRVPDDIKKLDIILKSKKVKPLFFQLYVDLGYFKNEFY